MTAKARAMQAQGIRVISFAAGEPDFNTPEVVCEAAIKALKDGQTKYAPSRGIPALREAVVAKTARENGFTCQDNQIVVSCGAKHSLYNALMVLVDPGDEVVLFAPYWMTYADQIRLAGGVPKVVSCGAETCFTPTPDQIREAITARTKVIIVNSPGNPTGGAWNAEQYAALAEVTERHGTWVISDEIYERLLYTGTHQSVAALNPSMAERTVTILGCSKTYAMTGWRIGFAVAPAPVAAAMADLQDQVTSNATTFAQVGAVAALNMPATDVDAMREEFRRRRDLGLGLLQKMAGIHCPEPHGAFYFFVDVSEVLARPDAPWTTDLALADWLLEHAHIACVPGSVFEGPGHLRFSYATSPAQIEEGFHRLHAALNPL